MSARSYSIRITTCTEITPRSGTPAESPKAVRVERAADIPRVRRLLRGPGRHHRRKRRVTARSAGRNLRRLFTRVEDMLPLVKRQYLTPGAPNPAGQVVTVEFYNKTLDHYFMSANPDDINDLDTGVSAAGSARACASSPMTIRRRGRNPCAASIASRRTGDSHFYSASPAECCATDRGEVPGLDRMKVPTCSTSGLPDATGACPTGTTRCGDSSTRPRSIIATRRRSSIRDQMRASPSVWVPEGYGPDRPIMCAAVK